ncbi:MAG: DUF2721 domain-containing protein [Novosphingobium sp.]|nr:DUF2721 domain-containing protein [Novosphingobium sp.]
MIAQTIQLALAPVFLLVAISNIMNILSVRLGRIVDRSRALQDRHGVTEGMEHDRLVAEIRSIDRRIVMVGRAIALLVLSGLIVGVTVTLLFVEEIGRFDLHGVAALTFLVAIGLLMWALLLFLRETQLAAASLRIPEHLLELDRTL